VRGHLKGLGVLVAVVGVVLVFSGLAYGASGDEAVRSAEEAAGAAAERIETARQIGTLASHYVAYNRINASWYGKTYTNNDHLYSTTGYQYLFKNWPGADCQNFVSQCVWYGFGGTLGASYINGHLFPMLDGVPGAESWWCDAYNAVPSGTWNSVPNFFTMVTNNYTNDRLGVQGTAAIMLKDDFNDLDIGDCIVHNDWGHVYVVTMLYDADGDGRHTFKEIYVSAHSQNIQNHNLFDQYPDFTHLIILRILRYRDA